MLSPLSKTKSETERTQDAQTLKLGPLRPHTQTSGLRPHAPQTRGTGMPTQQRDASESTFRRTHWRMASYDASASSIVSIFTWGRFPLRSGRGGAGGMMREADANARTTYSTPRGISLGVPEMRRIRLSERSVESTPLAETTSAGRSEGQRVTTCCALLEPSARHKESL